MQRLFIGIDPPAPVKDQLLLLQGGIAAARWQTRAQFHLTLRFIGDADRHQAQDISAALHGISHPAFELALSGTGMFDRKEKIHTLYVGVTPDVPVRTLHNKVDQALARIGIAPEQKSYLPHITLARLNHHKADLANFMALSGGVSSAPFQVHDICLYESTLTRDAAVYTILGRYPLR